MLKLSLSVLRARNFRLLLLGRTLATFAWHAQAIIVGWQVYSLTKSPFMLGLTGLAEAGPALLCALFAGHFVDVGKPNRIMAGAIGVLALNSIMLLLIGGGFVDAPGGSAVPWLFLGVFVSGVARSFFSPSSQALLSSVVAKDDVPAGNAWLASGFYAAATSGPAVAGLIYGGYGPRGAWVLPAILAVFSCAAIACIRMEQRPRTVERREAAMKSIYAGWRFIVKNPVLLSMMTLELFAVLFGGATSMLPAYADQVLHVGSTELGALRAATWLGAMPLSLFLALFPPKRFSATGLMMAIAAFGISIMGFGLSTSFPLSMLCLAVAGASASYSFNTRGTIMQIITPENMRGRVFSINMMFAISANEIGAFESGVAAKFLGLVPSIVAGGALTLFIVCLVALSSPKFRRTVVGG